MTYEKIINDIKQKNYSPIYFLWGEESYYIDKIADFASKNILSESEQAFNQTVLYGKDVDVHSIIEIARRFPMMSAYQVIIVKEAQDIKKIEVLESYLDAPLKSTILFMCYKYKKVDKRTNFYKKLSKYVEFNSAKVPDYQLSNWIITYVKSLGKEIDVKGASLLAEFLGNNLSKIVGEIEKLSIVLNDKGISKISPEIIEQNIGISKDYNIFELQKAIISKDVFKANSIVKYFAANQKEHHITPGISILGGFFIKLLLYHYLPSANRKESDIVKNLKISPYAVKDYQKAGSMYNANRTLKIISLFREYDLRSKGVDDAGTDSGELFRELVYKILHV